MPAPPPRFPTLAAWEATLPAPIRNRRPLAGGLSGATIERLALATTAEQPARSVILKSLHPATDWLMLASGDTLARETRLPGSALWARLPAAIDSPVLAVIDGAADDPALVLADVGDAIFPASRSYGPADDDLLARIIGDLAALHAACWRAPELAAPWLATPADALLFLTPQRLSRATSAADTYGSQAQRMWPYLWRFLDDATAAPLLATLTSPARLVAAAASAPATLVHGDLWLANVAYAPGPATPLILLDWALCTAGPAPYDSLWLAHTWHAADPDRALTLHRAALVAQGVADARDDAEWSLLIDLAWVRTFLLGAEWLVRDIRGATTVADEAEARARLARWATRAAEIVVRRGW